MTLRLRLILICAAITLGSMQRTEAQQASIVHGVTYIEVLPAAEATARTLLSSYAAVSRNADGNSMFQVLQRIGRANHFAILETWADDEARDASTNSQTAERFRADLAPLLYSPPDARRHIDLIVAPTIRTSTEGVVVLTHIDVFPANIELVVQNLEALASASRNERGCIKFDVWVSDRANHMTLLEIWDSARAQQEHLAMPHTLAFRRALAPLHGALYDERLYRPL